MTAMTCERFEEILVDYFEGDLPAETKASADEHARECASCAAIVSDIDRITRDAAALPPMRPSRDLWMEIEDRISAPVLTLAQPAHSRGRHFGSAWMAAAAAALVVTTAGITYVVTSRTTAKPVTLATLPAKPVVVTVDSSVAPVGQTPSAVASAQPKNETVAAEPRIAAPSGRLASNTPSQERATSSAPVGTLGSPQEDAAYAHEIATLERIVNSPKSGLDPATVKVVKTNLKVIDDAIAQSKAALAKDPASPLLFNQMTRAMGRKVELLRTMASLSSST